MDELSPQELFKFICEKNTRFFGFIVSFLPFLSNDRCYTDDNDLEIKPLKIIGISHFIENKNKLNLNILDSGWIFPFNGTNQKKNNLYLFEQKLRSGICSRGTHITDENLKRLNDGDCVFDTREITFVLKIQELVDLCNEMLECNTKQD